MLRNLMLCCALYLAASCSGCATTAKARESGPHPFATARPIEQVIDDNHNAILARLDSLDLKIDNLADAVDDIGPLSTPPAPPMAKSGPLYADDDAVEGGTITTPEGQYDLSGFIHDWYREGSVGPEKLNLDVVGGNLTSEEAAKLPGAIANYEAATLGKQPFGNSEQLAIGDPVNPGLSSADCPNGQCPVRSRAVTVSTPTVQRSFTSNVYSSASSYGKSTAASRRATRIAARKCR